MKAIKVIKGSVILGLLGVAGYAVASTPTSLYYQCPQNISQVFQENGQNSYAYTPATIQYQNHAWTFRPSANQPLPIYTLTSSSTTNKVTQAFESGNAYVFCQGVLAGTGENYLFYTPVPQNYVCSNMTENNIHPSGNTHYRILRPTPANCAA